MLLETIRSLKAANWYKVGRATLGRLSTPAALAEALRRMVEAGLIAESRVSGEPLPRLAVTEAGQRALEDSGEEIGGP